MLEIIGCPECAAPAEVVTRFVLDSTDGPVEHATVACAGRHRFTMPVERLAGDRHAVRRLPVEPPLRDPVQVGDRRRRWPPWLRRGR